MVEGAGRSGAADRSFGSSSGATELVEEAEIFGPWFSAQMC
jgi:hypothetical protein